MVSALVRVKRSTIFNASLVGIRRPFPVTPIVPLKFEVSTTSVSPSQ